MSDTPLVDAEALRLRLSVASHQAMVAFARDLERVARQMAQALESAKKSVSYTSLEDSVGYYVCCEAMEWNPHRKDCRLNKALLEWNKFLAENKG